jgi:hypothetical protein
LKGLASTAWTAAPAFREQAHAGDRLFNELKSRLNAREVRIDQSGHGMDQTSR